MCKSVLVVQSFGRIHEYRRATLTILSLYSFVRVEDFNVILFTDNPEWFSNVLEGLPIHYEKLTPAIIREMRGEIDFLHRMKIVMIEKAFNRSNGNLLYADSDTFFIENPERFLESVSEKNAFMHKKEYQFSALANLELPGGKPFVDFYNLIKCQHFKLPNSGDLTIPLSYYSWNAGVMVFHKSHKRLLEEVYSLTHEFYPRTLNHASEQYAFSVVMQNHTNLQDCFSICYHYWHRVKKNIADHFLERNFPELQSCRNLHDRFTVVGRWIKTLPRLFSTHYERHRDNAIQEFNMNQFRKGYKSVLRAVLKRPLLDVVFIKDILYHSKRAFRRVLK